MEVHAECKQHCKQCKVEMKSLKKKTPVAQDCLEISISSKVFLKTIELTIDRIIIITLEVSMKWKCSKTSMIIKGEEACPPR